GVEVAPHGQRDLVGLHLVDGDVESILEVVDQSVAFDDFSDDVDVVEPLRAELSGLQVRLGQEQRQIDPDLVGSLLGEAYELGQSQRGRSGGEIGRHRQDL